MITECTNPLDPASCIGDVIGGVAGDAARGAWDSVCKSFADSAVWLLKQFADAFVAFPKADVNAVTGPYAISMWIAGVLAVLLVLGQVIRTAATHDGSAIAHGLVGLGKTVLAIAVIRYVGDAAMTASNEIAHNIIDQSLGGDSGLKERLAGLFEFASTGQITAPMSLWLVVALVGIALTVVLWFEMLLCNAALLVLIATAPIAAAGQVSESTKAWWSKLCAAVVQLIALKPIIALIFAVGFGVLSKGDTTGKDNLVTTLSGLLILLMAVVAWPVIAKFMTFTSVSFAGGGMAGLLGFAAGRANSGGGTAGVNPAQLAQATEARTMASTGANAAGAAESASLMGTSSAATGASASGGMAAGAGALGAVAAPLAVAAVGVDVAQRAVNSLSSRMEQMADHADLDGANPHNRPAGYPQYQGGWTGSDAGAPVQQANADRIGAVATLDPPAMQTGVMPETRTSEPVDLPPPAPQQPTYTSPIEEVGR